MVPEDTWTNEKNEFAFGQLDYRLNQMWQFKGKSVLINGNNICQS